MLEREPIQVEKGGVEIISGEIRPGRKVEPLFHQIEERR